MTISRRSARLLAAFGSTAVLALTGCGGDEEPAATREEGRPVPQQTAATPAAPKPASTTNEPEATDAEARAKAEREKIDKLINDALERSRRRLKTTGEKPELPESVRKRLEDAQKELDEFETQAP